MVDRIRNRGVWGRMTAPARVNKVKRRKENAEDNFQDHLKKRHEKNRTEDKTVPPKPAAETGGDDDQQSAADTEAENKQPSAKSETGGHVDIRI